MGNGPHCALHSIKLQKLVEGLSHACEIGLENNNSTLITTLTPLAPPLDNDIVDNRDAFVTPRNENNSYRKNLPYQNMA